MADSANITRRRALTSIAAIPAMGTAAIVPAMAEPIITPRERLDAAIVELKAAAEALDPTIRHWTEGVVTDDVEGRAARIILCAFNW